MAFNFLPRRQSRRADDNNGFILMGRDNEKRPSVGSEEVTQLENVSSTKLDQVVTSFEARGTQPELYRDGQLVLVPAKTRDPKDPLNMTTARKLAAMISLCCFGALAAAAELILGAMLPVFALEYAGLNAQDTAKLSTVYAALPIGTDPLAFLNNLPGPPITQIYLLASLPVLMIGLSNLILVPLAISIGRRPTILFTGVIAIAGCVWAGESRSLPSHLGARCIQAIGAGTVESLIPFVIQDIVHVHERNTWMSGIFAAQGVIIIVIGFSSPYCITYLSWRWVYFITAIGAAFFLVGVYFFMPETRYNRSRAEMNGIPRDDGGVEYSRPTMKENLALFTKNDWRKGWLAFLDTFRTFFYPSIFFITMLNSVMIAAALGAAYTVAPNLLVRPWTWDFLHLGFLLVPVLISALFVGLVTGKMADLLVNFAAKRGNRSRIPEDQLLNLILPTIVAVIGSVVFGVAGASPDQYHWAVFLMGFGFMTFGFLGANTVGAVYVLECYPHLAGPSLVNIASFRCLIAFILSFKVSEWIIELGYFNSMMIYTGLIAFCSFLIPIVYVYGPAWRRRWPATHFGDGRLDH